MSSARARATASFWRRPPSPPCLWITPHAPRLLRVRTNSSWAGRPCASGQSCVAGIDIASTDAHSKLRVTAHGQASGGPTVVAAAMAPRVGACAAVMCRPHPPTKRRAAQSRPLQATPRSSSSSRSSSQHTHPANGKWRTAVVNAAAAVCRHCAFLRGSSTTTSAARWAPAPLRTATKMPSSDQSYSSPPLRTALDSVATMRPPPSPLGLLGGMT